MQLQPPMTPTGESRQASSAPVRTPCFNSAVVPRFCRTPRPCLDSDSSSPRFVNLPDVIGIHGSPGLASKRIEKDSLSDIKLMLMRHQEEAIMQLSEWMTQHEKCLHHTLGKFQDSLNAFQCKIGQNSSIQIDDETPKSAHQLEMPGSQLLSVPKRSKAAARRARSSASQSRDPDLDTMDNPDQDDADSPEIPWRSFRSVDSSSGTRYISVDEVRQKSLMQQGGFSMKSMSSNLEKKNNCFHRVVNKMNLIVNNFVFELTFATLICINSVVLGVEVAIASSSPKEELPHLFYYLAIIFTALFLVELVMRLISEGGFVSFFVYSDLRAWNWFDSISVMCSLIEVGFNFVLLGGGSQSVTRIMRIARMSRLPRVLRVARIVRFVTQLRVLVISISSSLQTLCWALFLLLMIIYVFAVLLTQATAEHFSEDPDYDPESLLGSQKNLAHYWGSLHASMYTLFMSVAGGVSWELVFLPITEVHWIWGAFFTAFIAFTSFSLINVMTAVFCQSAIESAQKSMDVKWQRMCTDKRKHIENLKCLFKSMEKNNKGTISLKKLQTCWSDLAMQRFLHSMDLAPDDCWNFFAVLDANGDKEVSAQEFVDGCLRLKGSARAFDMAVMLYELRHLSKQNVTFMNQMHQDMNMLLSEVDDEPTYPSHGFP